VEGLAELNSSAKMPIAGGDSLYGVRGFFRFVDSRAVDILTPDLKQCGGMLELKKVGAMAEGAGLPVALHGPAGPVASVAAAHVCASIPNFGFLEYAFGEVPWRANLINPAETLEGGSMTLLEAPGFGVRLNDALAVKHAV
jgi:galactonate dehydratase